MIENLPDNLRPLVERFIAAGCMTSAGSTDISHPSQVWGECWRLADALRECLLDAGLDAWLPLGSGAPGYSGPQPEALGYTDRLNEGCENHYWTCVRLDGRVWAIDLSAAQYGYPGPVAAVGDGSELWAQEGEVDPQPRLTLAQISANREAAGFDPELLDPRQCDVWIDPQGLRHACKGLTSQRERWLIVDLPEAA
jgi:hypothetical protein